MQVDIHKGSEFVNLEIDLVLPQAPCECKSLSHIFDILLAFDFIMKTGYTEKINHAIEGF